MARELVFLLLVLGLCGPVLAATGALSTTPPSSASGRWTERVRWVHLWLPLVPTALLFAALVGWLAQEPAACDERLRPLGLSLAAMEALVLLRALRRAAIALLRRGAAPPIATHGLLSPELLVRKDFAVAVDEAALSAAVAHEAAHARHLDPLRLWLAQLLTDLQWPLPAAGRRLRAWREALEWARDEEARSHGVEGEDLAAAVLVAVRLSGPTESRAVATLTGDELALAERVERLLAPLPVDRPGRALADSLGVLVAAALLVAGYLGMTYGEELLRRLPGVVS